MPKGRTNNSVRILVAPQFAEHPCIVAWRETGHTVETWTPIPLESYDLILAPTAHFWNDLQWDMAAVALAAARRNKKVRLANEQG